jgi:hypothetical protein
MFMPRKPGGGILRRNCSVLFTVTSTSAPYYLPHGFLGHTLRNALRGGKPDRKPYHAPVVSEIQTKQSINEENSSLFMNSIL